MSVVIQANQRNFTGGIRMAIESLPCFKAYDVRGIVPDELDTDLAYRIAQAYADLFRPDRVAIGRDIRPSGVEIAGALTQGFVDAGVDVVDLGLCGTEEVYFATFHLELGGGIMVTASHNPTEYNGMKFVRKEAIPISGDSGLQDIAEHVLQGGFTMSLKKGQVERIDIRETYVEHLMSYIDKGKLKPLRIACNPGNGCAGPVIESLRSKLPFDFVVRHGEPDGTFPNGVPNPLLPENRASTSELVRESNAAFGVAWDGDYDRCFFFDEKGEFIEGYYIVGLLAQAILKQNPGAPIIYDPRLVWNTIEIVKSLGGRPVLWKSGHAFIKEKMREEDAAYGGEMSAHHYFRDFSYCDSGMIPWLLIAQLLSEEDRPLSELVAERIERFPCSGEINRKLDDPEQALERLEETFKDSALETVRIDGLSMEFTNWRFNARLSNTEPLLRLNVESRGDRNLLNEKTAELLRIIEA